MASRTHHALLLLVLAAAAVDAYMLSNPVLPARLAATSRISRTSPLRAAATTHSLRSALRMTDKAEAEEAKAPASTGGTFEFYTRPRTTNANWGTFFEIATKDSDVYITGIRAGGHSFANFEEYTRLDVTTYTKEGTCVGFETDEKAWKCIGKAEGLKVPRVEVGDSFAQFTPLPLEDPVLIPANSVQGFVIHTNKKTGLALRRKLNFDSNNAGDPYFKDWIDGVTDEGDHLKLIAGLCPGEKLFEDVSDSNNARAFVGVIDYTLEKP
mmetsp:Transcript_24951/g.59308  ORF Transcript_24951/g.59308 Transcript_24951/m.59308 type:complete len:268 (-) Transcript_24951:144-947(-)|eukprot:CAMPEP_0177718332 /NCGR_PEP_ID=MMETSP0484_2-20121128/15521_1 /TAXON_ID=354590 /ORGANISM="Rhodomonas lens, Strain RHODO" /LENGTH=267 /DNA_ID=CAMNT_0019230491 /DNA_START=159 /DNA_END=962 /DNA_ORIENTATION=-